MCIRLGGYSNVRQPSACARCGTMCKSALAQREEREREKKTTKQISSGLVENKKQNISFSSSSCVFPKRAKPGSLVIPHPLRPCHPFLHSLLINSIWTATEKTGINAISIQSWASMRKPFPGSGDRGKQAARWLSFLFFFFCPLCLGCNVKIMHPRQRLPASVLYKYSPMLTSVYGVYRKVPERVPHIFFNGNPLA